MISKKNLLDSINSKPGNERYVDIEMERLDRFQVFVMELRTFRYFLITFCFAIRVWNWKLDTVTWIWCSNSFDILSFNFCFIFAINCILRCCAVWYWLIFMCISKRKISGTKSLKSTLFAFKYSSIVLILHFLILSTILCDNNLTCYSL